MKQFTVVSYDIPNDRRRTKVMKTLKGFGLHVQYSVFECVLEKKDLAVLHRKLSKLVTGEDSIRFYFIDQDDVARIEVLGSGGITTESLFYMH